MSITFYLDNNKTNCTLPLITVTYSKAAFRMQQNYGLHIINKQRELFNRHICFSSISHSPSNGCITQLHFKMSPVTWYGVSCSHGNIKHSHVFCLSHTLCLGLKHPGGKKTTIPVFFLVAVDFSMNSLRRRLMEG